MFLYSHVIRQPFDNTIFEIYNSYAEVSKGTVSPITSNIIRSVVIRLINKKLYLPIYILTNNIFHEINLFTIKRVINKFTYTRNNKCWFI